SDRAVRTTLTAGGSMVTFSHHYDDLGRIATIAVNDGVIAAYDYGTTGIGGPLGLSYSNHTKATFTYDGKMRQTGIDVAFAATPDSTLTFVASLHEALGSDSIPRMRQLQIGNGSSLTDVFEVDGDGRASAEKLTLPSITLPTGEISNAYVDQ